MTYLFRSGLALAVALEPQHQECPGLASISKALFEEMMTVPEKAPILQVRLSGRHQVYLSEGVY